MTDPATDYPELTNQIRDQALGALKGRGLVDEGFEWTGTNKDIGSVLSAIARYVNSGAFYPSITSAIDPLPDDEPLADVLRRVGVAGRMPDPPEGVDWSEFEGEVVTHLGRTGILQSFLAVLYPAAFMGSRCPLDGAPMLPEADGTWCCTGPVRHC